MSNKDNQTRTTEKQERIKDIEEEVYVERPEVKDDVDKQRGKK